MEFIIIALLTVTLTVYSWWTGYKLGERKGWNKGQNDMEKVYRSYFNYRVTGVQHEKKTTHDKVSCAEKQS